MSGLALGLMLMLSGALLAFVFAHQARARHAPHRWTPSRRFYRAAGAVELTLGTALVLSQLAGTA